MTPRRKDSTPVTAERIVDAALALIDQRGLEALTMRSLGERLGVDASSIYYHVPSQAVLLDLVADRIMGAIPAPPAPAPRSEPVDELVAAGRSYLDALVAHPNAVPLLATRPVRSLEIGALFDAILGSLYRRGSVPDASAARRRRDRVVRARRRPEPRCGAPAS